MSEKVNKDDLVKALEGLSALAKGHSSRGTVTTEVDSMRDGSVGAGSGTGATQLHHTPSNSDHAQWAGSKWRDVPDNGPGADSVSENGTDYQAQGKVMKSIMDKLNKGLALTAEEVEILKGAMDKKKAFPPAKDEEQDEDKPEPPVAKSLTDFAQEDEDVSKGLEVSEFLASFVDVFAKSLGAAEERIVSRTTSLLTSEAAVNGEFQKSLAGAVVALGEAIQAVAARVDAVEGAAVRAPKSVEAGYVAKSFEGAPGGEQLSKALVSSALVSLVERGEVNPTDVIRFESVGEISDQLYNKVRAHLGR